MTASATPPTHQKEHDMSKHQRGNKEFKKPKKAPEAAAPLPTEAVRPVQGETPAPRRKK
jgi:hypothetical protein